LSFSYWIDNLGFITEGKLAVIFIKPSLGVSNWPVILLHQQTQSSFLAPSSPRHHSPMRSVDLDSAYQHSQALARVGHLRVQGRMHVLQ
jgi:hypothetical protein